MGTEQRIKHSLLWEMNQQQDGVNCSSLMVTAEVDYF